MVEHCNYGGTLNEMLRDRLVCGINDDAIQRRSLSEEGLTFVKKQTIAQNAEAVTKNMKELHRDQKASDSDTHVHKVNRDKSTRKAKGDAQTEKGLAITGAANAIIVESWEHLRAVCSSKSQKANPGRPKSPTLW